jgi:hypothetical protein
VRGSPPPLGAGFYGVARTFSVPGCPSLRGEMCTCVDGWSPRGRLRRSPPAPPPRVRGPPRRAWSPGARALRAGTAPWRLARRDAPLQAHPQW